MDLGQNSSQKLGGKLTDEEKESLLSHLDQLKVSDVKNTIEWNRKRGFRACPFALFHFVLYRIFPLGCLLLYLSQRLMILYNGDTCLVSQSTIPEFAMKLADCNKCRDVVSGTVIDNITVIDFMQHYAYSSKPMLMKGAALDWPATGMFSFEYFKSLYNHNPDSLDHDVDQGQFFAYSSGIRDIGELMELLNEASDTTAGDTNHQKKKWYIGWSTEDPIIGAELKKHVRPPYFLPPGSSVDHLSWIFMGSPGPGASLHVDWVGRVSWQAQLSGMKTWTLVPPPECEHICIGFNITMNTGDIIVVDTNFWFHGTYVHPGNVSITYGTEFE